MKKSSTSKQRKKSKNKDKDEEKSVNKGFVSDRATSKLEEP